MCTGRIKHIWLLVSAVVCVLSSSRLVALFSTANHEPTSPNAYSTAKPGGRFHERQKKNVVYSVSDFPGNSVYFFSLLYTYDLYVAILIYYLFTVNHTLSNCVIFGGFWVYRGQAPRQAFMPFRQSPWQIVLFCILPENKISILCPHDRTARNHNLFSNKKIFERRQNLQASPGDDDHSKKSAFSQIRDRANSHASSISQIHPCVAQTEAKEKQLM
uniref:Uncharacterized protein n=1 Tax=Rhipicephalus zambeziensis TaxID=60191 RepID=A0A224YHU1_9ACAR